MNTKQRLKQRSILYLSALLLLSLSGCSDLGGNIISEVKPWQKGYLARQDMQFDSDPLESKFKRHIEASKEGSSGGYGIGGGGCGCN